MAGMSTANAQLRFTEAAAFSGDGFRLDKEQGVAFGVAICGGVSANGRDYPAEVRDRDKGIYEGVQVYIDHADKERKVREWFGTIRNPRTRVSDRKTIGDHHYPKNSQFTAEYEERAEKFPESLGFSHVAVCETKRVNGRESITAMRRAESVDLVARPATNKSLFESHQGNPAMEDQLKELTEKLAAATAEAATLKEQVTALTAENTTLKAEAKTLREQADAAAVAALFAEAKVTPNDVQREAVTAMTDPAKRKALVESFKAAQAGEKPESGTRRESSTTQPTIPTEGKAFAESLRTPK